MATVAEWEVEDVAAWVERSLELPCAALFVQARMAAVQLSMPRLEEGNMPPRKANIDGPRLVQLDEEQNEQQVRFAFHCIWFSGDASPAGTGRCGSHHLLVNGLAKCSGRAQCFCLRLAESLIVKGRTQKSRLENRQTASGSITLSFVLVRSHG